MKYLLILLTLSSFLFANETVQDELSFEEDFLESLEEVSEIATKTKLNIDDSPSFVTVLHSDKLQKLGIKDVFEALGQVPGVQLKREISGVPVVVFRGLDQKGEVKLMIDGVTINNSYRGSIYHFLDFPIELTERIEVIRGAGSVLYGSNAMSGVVNIITKSSQEESGSLVFASGGTYDSYKAGALVASNLSSVKIALDAYYQTSDKTIKIDANPSTQTGDSDRHLKDYSVGINLKSDKLSFIARLKESTIGNAYGIFSKLDDDKNKFDNTNRSLTTKLEYKESLPKENRINLQAGYSRYAQEVETFHPALNKTIDSDYKEESYFVEAGLISKTIQDNELLIGLRFETSNELQNGWKEAGVELPNRIVGADFSRDIFSIYLNDTYNINSSLDISAGLRYDNYSDFGDSYSPTLGLVYRANEKLRFKALYSHAFRAPSWVELTSNPDLEAEKSDSIEVGLVFKQNQSNTLRINFFTSRIDDMITKVRTYIQETKNEFYGSELEYIYSPNNQTEINLIASYIDANDENGDDLAGVANILASGSLSYKLDSGLIFGSLLKYVSSSKRDASDTRDDMAESIIFDQTISYNFQDFTASVVVKDLFDKGRYYTLPQNAYKTDFDDGGRTIMLNAALEF